jgi:hypothetical protein
MAESPLQKKTRFPPLCYKVAATMSRKMLEHYSHVRLEAKRRPVELLDAMQPVQ